MKKTILLTLLISILSISVSAGEINWLKDYEEAKAIAAETNKPILLDFTASWCKPCQSMDEIFWMREDVVQLSKDFVPVKIDFDRSTGLNSKYRIRSIPFVLATDSWGTGLVFHNGFGSRSADEIYQKLSLVPKDFSEIRESMIILEEDKKNPEALNSIANFYHSRKFYYQSNQYAERLLKVLESPEERENLMLNIGFNYLRSALPKDAKKSLKKFEKEFPQSPQMDVALYGQVVAYKKQDKLKKARKIFEQLKSQYPNSKYIQTAQETLR